MRRVMVLVCSVAVIGGCASYRSVSEARPGGPKVYSGTRMDWHAMQGNYVSLMKFPAQPPERPWLDLPFSAVLDTLVLPLTLPSMLYDTAFE